MSPVPPDAWEKPKQVVQEDCMTHLAIALFGGDEIFSNFGMWAFLAVGAVALFIGYTSEQVAHAQEVKEAIDAGEL